MNDTYNLDRSVSESDCLTIDVARVISERLPRYARFIPRWLMSLLERLIHQDELNGLLRSNAGREGADFCRGVLAELGVTYNVIERNPLPVAGDRRVIYVSNHPLGALDGIALIDMVARRHGCEPCFVVNDLLMAVKPLERVFVPVNKHGGQSRMSTDLLHRAFLGDAPVIVFPAGLVSRRSSDGVIRDLAWHKMVINKAVEYERDIVPLFFSGRNSSFFYNFAKLRVSIGLKFNVEMVLLPGEIFKCRHRCFDIVAGSRVASSSLVGGCNAANEAEALRNSVYDLEALMA